MSSGFQGVLDHLRSIAGTEAEKGRLFERLMQKFLRIDPLYRDRFPDVWLWPERAATRYDFDGGDFGIDLAAGEQNGGRSGRAEACASMEIDAPLHRDRRIPILVFQTMITEYSGLSPGSYEKFRVKFAATLSER